MLGRVFGEALGAACYHRRRATRDCRITNSARRPAAPATATAAAAALCEAGSARRRSAELPDVRTATAVSKSVLHKINAKHLWLRDSHRLSAGERRQ
jgi:hypothetical protein